MKENNIEIALVKEACKLCGALVNGPIIMNKILSKGEAEKVKKMHGQVIGYSKKPCDKCQELMSKGILLIEVDESKTDDRSNPWRTGRQFVITEETATKIFNDDKILITKAAFIGIEVTNLIGLDKVEPLQKS